MLLKCYTLYVNKFRKLSSGHRTENVSFHSNPKEGQCQRMFELLHNCTLSNSSKVMFKILQARLQLYMYWELPDVQAGLEKAEESVIKLPTFTESRRKQGNSRKTSTFASWTSKAFDCVNHNKLWKILKELGIPDHLTCLLRDLHAGQKATIRTGYGSNGLV